MKKIIILIKVSLIAGVLFAQNEVDALRYSYLIPGGTARYNGMAGSFGALGADASTLMFNPAGMGVYRTSDFTFSPAFVITSTDADYLGNVTDDYDFNFNINNFSYIAAIKTNRDEGLKSLNLGFSYNRLNNLHENILIHGTNNINSMTDWFASKANGYKYDQLDGFYTNLAWEGYLIDPEASDTTGTQYVSAYHGQYGQTQKQYISKSGYQGEYNFALAANIENKIFLGASLGLQSVRYKEVKLLEEVDDKDLINDFKSFSFKEALDTKGSGLNFKFGILFAPIDWVRVGASVHTPTFYSLRDNYFTSIKSSFNTASKSKNINSEYGTFNYELTSPFRANASLGFVIAKQALLNIDYEYVDYSMARLRSNDYAFFSENNNVRDEYKAGNNIRLGVEYKYGLVYFRGGGAYYDSPYKSSLINKNAYTLVYSGGIGVRNDFMYFDISYSYINNNNYYFMYEGYVDSPATELMKKQSRIVTTLGFKF